MKSVAVVGASGYAGRELLRLCARHPELEVRVAMAARRDPSGDAPEADREPPPETLDPGRFAAVDGVFLCTPHGAAAPLALAARRAGKAVVDLSADFRLRSAALYERTYGAPHPAPELLAGAVYGLTELRREAVAGARLVANPGCYPTSILLPLLPLLRANLIDRSLPVIADSKSGVSGAGKQPTDRTHFGAVHENCCAYGIGTHRHGAEIRQESGLDRLVFTPHLLPVFRGILSTIYFAPAAGASAAAARDCLAAHYASEPFVRVRRTGPPELRDVQRGNECHIAVADNGDLVVVVSVLDNLGKGAAGQALQNMNLMLGLEETAGLVERVR